MKHHLVAAVLSLTLIAPLAQRALAQEPAAPPPPPASDNTRGPMHQRRSPDPHREAMMLGKRLNLTTDQTAKLEPILTDRQSRMEALRSNTALDEKGRHQQMRSIQEDTQTKLGTVLTPDQISQMKEMRGKMGRRGHGGPNGPGGPDQPAPPTPPTA